MDSDPVHVHPFVALTEDGCAIQGRIWRHEGGPCRAVVIICPATSVRCDYYARFAQFLHEAGRQVVLFDYRGIGRSRARTLRGSTASWYEWGAVDCAAIMRDVQAQFPGSAIDVVAHSYGGCTVGLSGAGRAVRRIVTVGAQFAYWRDYARERRIGMLLKWHVVMPALTRICGYFPGRSLGWLEDTPAGVVRDWVAPVPHLANLPSVRRSGVQVESRFAQVRAPMLAISLSDDPYATPQAVDRLLDTYSHAPRTHLRIAPDEIGVRAVGHFAFFHARHADTLWPVALAWLDEAAIPPDAPGRILRAP